MLDPNLEDFYRRIARVEAARARGFGFEADGTIGRSYYSRPARRQMSLLRPLVVTLMCIVGLKAAIHYNIGPDIYAARVAELQAGSGFDRLGGVIMAPDPLTLWLADALRTHLPPLL